MEAEKTALWQDASLTYLPAEKFKTSALSAQFVVPLAAESASANALIPSLLQRGTASSPDMGLLSARMDRLYGARIDSAVRKVGERLCVGFSASLVDDRYVPGGERLLEPAADLLGELLLDPAMEDGGFVPAYFESEKTNLLDAIRSQMNDKREWAARRLLEEMCAGEAYGVPRLGDEASAERLEADALLRHYRALLPQRMEFIYCGSAPRERVEAALRRAFSALPRGQAVPLPPCPPHPVREDVLHVTDSMDVTQGKLSMGFSCESEDIPALLVGNSLFGGNSNSKLFLNVREKLSLCYYASSVFHRHKRLITVASGIEFQNYQRAYDEILVQLDAVQRGDLEDWELEGARSTLLNSYASLGDSQGKLEHFYLAQAAMDLDETPEELARQVREVTLDRVMEAMESVRLDTVYFLRGKEAAE